MKIYAINSINFTAKSNKPPVNDVKKIQQSIDDLKTTKLYAPIDKYLKEEYNTKEYINSFKDFYKEFYKEFKHYEKLSSSEMKYVIDMMTTIDLTPNVNKIPRNYITDKMQKLLDAQK